MNARQSAAVLGLLAALYAVALVLLAPKVDSFQGEFSADALLMLAAGLLFASPPVLAIWSVHGEARTVNRLLVPTWLFCAFFLAAGYGQVRNYGSGSAEILLLMATGWLTAYMALLVALRVLRAVRGWRLRVIEASRPGSADKRRQFTIRCLLVWTAAVAALCAGFRWLAAYGFEIAEEPSAGMLYAVLIEGTIMGLMVALAGLPVVGVAWIVLPDGRRPYLRWSLAVVTTLGIAAGSVVFGCWINLDEDDMLAAALVLMTEVGVLATGLVAACVLRGCGYRLVRPSSPPSMADATAPAAVRIGSRRFAYTLAAFGMSATLLAAYAPFRFETWRRADESQRWVALGWNASFDDEGQVAGLQYLPDHDLAGSELLLAAVPSLRSLDFARSQLADAQLQQYLTHCPAMAQLESLNLSSTKVTDLGLSRLDVLVSLKDLNVSDTSVSLSQVPSLPRLESLVLDGTAVWDAELVNLAAFVNLKTLRLLGTNVTDAGLANLRTLPALSWLDLSATDVTDDAVASLAPLTQLRHVNLELTAVSEAGLVALSKALPEADINVGADDASLDRVFSGRYVISRSGSLAYVTGPITWASQSLRRLHLRGNYPAGHRVGSTVFVNAKTVTDAGLKSLAGLTAIEELDLRESGVTDAGLVSLAKLTTLTRLDLRGTAVTDAGGQSLAKALPGCTILR